MLCSCAGEREGRVCVSVCVCVWIVCRGVWVWVNVCNKCVSHTHTDARTHSHIHKHGMLLSLRSYEEPIKKNNTVMNLMKYENAEVQMKDRR